MTVEKQTFEQPKAERVAVPTMITNIVATLKGTQPESAGRTYVVSGHYDSMCTSPIDAKCDAPGANDDASGTAAVLEMARVMAKQKFDATIIFMAVAGEEQGLLGSTYFAEQAKQKGMDIEAMFTNDIIGNSLGGNGVRDRHTVRVFSEGVPSNESPAEANVRRGVGGENDSASRQLARFIKETAGRYVPGMRVMMVYRRDRYLRGGDHRPFLERGFAAVRFTETNEDYGHQHQNVRKENGVQYGDLPDFVDFNYIADVARVNAASLAMLALAPARPKNVVVVTARLTNDTDLKWDANKEPDLAGYEVESYHRQFIFETLSIEYVERQIDRYTTIDQITIVQPHRAEHKWIAHRGPHCIKHGSVTFIAAACGIYNRCSEAEIRDHNLQWRSLRPF